MGSIMAGIMGGTMESTTGNIMGIMGRNNRVEINGEDVWNDLNDIGEWLCLE